MDHGKKPPHSHENPDRTFVQVSAEDQLRLKNRALNASAEGITIADARQPDQPLIYANDGFERLTGYSAESVMGRNCRFLQGPGTDPQARATIRRAIEERRECVVEILNYRKNGEPFWNRLSITPIQNDAGEVTHFVGVQSDVTARRRAEEALQQSNQKLEEINRRIKTDLELAAQIQRGFLPDPRAKLKGLTVAWELHSCDELAGDTLNAAALDDRQTEFYVIDVSGHGVPAALLSVTLNHWLEPAVGRPGLSGFLTDSGAPEAAPSPVRVVETLNRQFPLREETGQFFTLLYGLYDDATRKFRFVSAGHPAPILITKSGESSVHDKRGFPVGIVPDPGYEMTELKLNVGDRIYIYSDGLVEALNEREEPFGVERVQDILRRSCHETLQQTISLLSDSVKQWSGGVSFEDDVSILAFEVGQ